MVIRPQLGDIGPMDLSRFDDCIDAGILAGRKAVPQIKRLILDKRFEQWLRVKRIQKNEEAVYALYASGRGERSLNFFVSGVRAADSPEDQKIARWLSDIDHAIRKRGLQRHAGFAYGSIWPIMRRAIGQYDLAASGNMSLLLAGRPRPGRARQIFHTKLGNMRMALGRIMSARSRAYDDALHDSPKDWDANLARARAFVAADIDQRAIESYERCIKLRPSGRGAIRRSWPVFMKMQGFLGKALAFVLRDRQRSPASDPKPVQIYLHMADCYVHAKKYRAMAVSASVRKRKARAPASGLRCAPGRDLSEFWGYAQRRRSRGKKRLKRGISKRDDVRLKA